MASEARGKTIAKVVAVALIVGLFSAFYCWSFWDPIGAMKRVPIGIVNLDEGAEVNGKEVNIGSEIAGSAVEGSDANFVELDEQALADGVENSGYSMVFEIPADFSSKVTAGMTDVPQAADLEIYKNIRYNYIYAQLSTQIEKAFEGSVNSAIANAYVTGAYSGLEQARDGLQEASEGSGKLADGASTASEGITTLSSGASALSTGAKSVADGLSSLSSGLTSGKQQLDSAQSSLLALSTQLGAGSESAGALADGATAAQTCYQAALEATKSGSAVGGKTAAEWLAAGNAAIAQVSQGASSMATQLSGAASGVGSGATALGAASESISSAIDGIGSPDVAGQTLAYGQAQVVAGLESMSSGLSSVQGGVGQLAAGASELGDATTDGAETISDSLGASSDDMGAYVADPTSVNEERYGSLDYYGQGFSPFFMTTSLWLGALIIFFIIEPLWPKNRHAGRVRTVVGRLPLYALVCAFEAAAVTLFAWGIGVLDAHSASPLLLFAYALGVSLSFMLIMQFLNMTLGVIGKALAVLTLIFQLACSGGTLPVDLGQSFVAALNPFLPFTYAIDGFREVITYVNGATIAGDLGMTAVFGLAFFVLSLATWGFAERRRDAEAKSTLAWNKEEEPEGETGPGAVPSVETGLGTVSPIGQRACSE